MLSTSVSRSMSSSFSASRSLWKVAVLQDNVGSTPVFVVHLVPEISVWPAAVAERRSTKPFALVVRQSVIVVLGISKSKSMARQPVLVVDNLRVSALRPDFDALFGLKAPKGTGGSPLDLVVLDENSGVLPSAIISVFVF